MQGCIPAKEVRYTAVGPLNQVIMRDIRSSVYFQVLRLNSSSITSSVVTSFPDATNTLLSVSEYMVY